MDATILVEQAVVDVITEQQQWVVNQLGQQPAYLFVSMRRNYQGLRPRHYESQSEALRRLDDIVGLVDQAGQPLRFTQTHRLRHTRATELLNAGVPVHVVQRYLGHRSPEMTMRYAQTLAAVAEAEFLRYKKIGADARDLDIDPLDLYEQAQLDRRTDRILPNGYCMLPPTQACDRGNACLNCSHFATDHQHLQAMQEQRQHTLQIIEQRQTAFVARHGEPMSSQHVWLAQRQRELDALEAIIERLADESDNLAVRGAGTAGRVVLPITPIATSGAHHQLITPPDGTGGHGPGQ